MSKFLTILYQDWNINKMSSTKKMWKAPGFLYWIRTVGAAPTNVWAGILLVGVCLHVNGEVVLGADGLAAEGAGEALPLVEPLVVRQGLGLEEAQVALLALGAHLQVRVWRRRKIFLPTQAAGNRQCFCCRCIFAGSSGNLAPNQKASPLFT